MALNLFINHVLLSLISVTGVVPIYLARPLSNGFTQTFL